jgi:hypothetical protein
MNRTDVVIGGLLGVLAVACTPDVGSDPTPTSMQLDLTATPPRAPQPTALIINPDTGKIDFGLTGTPLPDDCAAQAALTPAQCEFDKWLETLNGFPTVTVASAPASAALDPATATPGETVVVVDKTGAAVNVAVGFDDATTSLTLTPPQPWALGGFYWAGVRGYDNGVRDAAGGRVVGSPTMALLKETDPLTCGATEPAAVEPHCPGFEVVAQSAPSTEAALAQLFQLEAIRTAYNDLGGFAAMAGAGLPREEIAVLWGFPIHTNSVPLLVPGTMAVPHMPAADTIAVGVQGPVAAASVSAFVVREQNGPVVVMDLTAANAGDLAAGFPPVVAGYAEASGAIVIKAAAPFTPGHLIGIFMTNGIHSPDGAPLVASPVSVLLTLTSPLIGDDGHSTVSGVSDSDAAMLELGREALQPLLDNPIFAPLTGVTRANLVYAYAFVPGVQP